MLAQWGHSWSSSGVGMAGVWGALLLAAAALAGYLLQRRWHLPKVLGYAAVGTVAGLLGFSAAPWPLQGPALYLLELGVAIVLFECGGRLPLRWFRHNPMVLVQSLAEAACTYVAVFYTLRWLALPASTAAALALIAMAASPLVLARVVGDTRSAGPVTDRAMALATLSTLYALALGSAKAQMLTAPAATLWQEVVAVLAVLGIAVAVALLLCGALRLALHWMSPSSENTAIVMLACIAAAAALASLTGGSAALSALLGGMLLKHIYPKPWAWPQQLGILSALITMAILVLVATVAAQAGWHPGVALFALALVLARWLGKAAGVGLGHLGSGASWQQSLWVACAMAPMSAVALLITSQLAAAAPARDPAIAAMALPAILLMELLGAWLATWALRRAKEALPPPTTARSTPPTTPGA